MIRQAHLSLSLSFLKFLRQLHDVLKKNVDFEISKTWVQALTTLFIIIYLKIYLLFGIYAIKWG